MFGSFLLRIVSFTNGGIGRWMGQSVDEERGRIHGSGCKSCNLVMSQLTCSTDLFCRVPCVRLRSSS